MKGNFNEASLAAQLPVYVAPEYTETIDIDTIYKDPELIEFAKEVYKNDIPEDADVETLTQTGAFMALTKAMTLDPAVETNPHLVELSSSLKQKYEDVVNNNEALRTNCYALAIGDYKNLLMIGAEPGHKMGQLGLNPEDKTISNYIRLAEEDGLQYAGTTPEELNVPEGHHIAMLYVHEGVDYHWARLDQGQNGELVEHDKFGVAATSVNSRVVENIYDLMSEEFDGNDVRGDGYVFGGFFYVPDENFNAGLDELVNPDEPDLDNQTLDKNVASVLDNVSSSLPLYTASAPKMN